jgi:glycosyltransferase involved in cell wall biosynthesis
VARRAVTFSVSPHEIDARLASARGVFENVDLFVAPSPSLAEEYVRLGLPRSKLRTSDYGFERLAPAPRDPRAAGEPLRVGFAGTLVWHKGPHVLIEAVKRLPRNSCAVTLHGDPTVFPDYVAMLRRQADGWPVRFAGPFTSDEAPRIFGEMDVLVVPSLWLENSPLVIHEAFMLGVPVIGARMGGIADLVTDGVNGRLFDPANPAQLAEILRSVAESPALAAGWARALPNVKSLAEDAADWDRAYRSVVRPATA